MLRFELLFGVLVLLLLAACTTSASDQPLTLV